MLISLLSEGIQMIEANSKIEYLGDPLRTTFILDCVKGEEDGKDVFYF